MALSEEQKAHIAACSDETLRSMMIAASAIYVANGFDAESALSPAAISASIFFVTSGNAGHPSGVENLIPLYSGGLCEAVKLITPSALL